MGGKHTTKAVVFLATLFMLFVLLKLPYLSHYVLWDEAVYLGMGKYIYSAGASGLWEMIRPLGLPLLTGLWWKIGFNELVASRVAAVAFSLALVFITYLIGRELFDENTGLLAAFLLAATPVFFYYAEYVMTDHISALFLYIAIYCLIKKRYAFAGVAGGLAFYFKFTHILFIIGAALFLVFAYKKRYPKTVYWLALCFGFVALYFTTNFVLYHAHFSPVDAVLRPYTDAAAYQNNPYQNVSQKTFGETLFSFIHSPYNIIFNEYFGFLALAAVLLVPLIRRQISGEKHWIALSFFALYFVHAAVIPYKNERFWIFLLPVIVIYAAAVYMYLSRQTFIVQTVTSAFFVFSLFLVAHAHFVFPTWYDAGSPNMAFERYFDERGIDGPVLTSDPRFAAYSDARYIPAYDILNKNGLYVNDWERDIVCTAAVYNDKSVPCFVTDAQCLAHKAAIEDRLYTEFTPLETVAYNGANITFYTS